MQIRFGCACAALVGLTIAAPVQANLFNLNGGLTWLTLRGTDTVIDTDLDGINVLPSSGTLTPTAVGATATADYSATRFGFVSDDVEYSLGANGVNFAFADLYGQVFFTPTANVGWTLSGSLTWAGGVANAAGLFARIIDTGTMADVTLHNYGSAGMFTSESLTIGSGGGNFINIIGPTSGTLLAGHQYEFVYELSAEAHATTPTNGTALGSISLAIVPEPGSAAILASGVAVLFTRRRR